MEVKRKVRGVLMVRKKEAASRIQSVRGTLAQSKFGERVGVTQPMVSSWEAGREVPSPEMYLRLANFAARPEDKIFFLQQAGLRADDILAAARGILSERNAPPVKGEIIRVPRFRETEHGREEAGPSVQQPTEFLPNPDATIALSVDERSFGIADVPSGVYILDTSVLGTSDLNICTGIIMVRYAPESPAGWDAGLYTGRIQEQERETLTSYQVILRLAPLVLPAFEHRQYQTPLCLGIYEDLGAMSDLAWEDKQARWQRTTGIKRQVFSKFPFTAGVSIVGKVVGYYPAKGTATSEVE